MKSKILYIEDEPENLALVQQMVEYSGYEFYGAETGVDGIQIAVRVQPDLILCDLNLPDLSGYTVIQKLRKYPEVQKVAILALTGSAGKDDERKILAAGFNGFIAKPFKMDDLLQKIKQELKPGT